MPYSYHNLNKKYDIVAAKGKSYKKNGPENDYSVTKHQGIV